jgi:hypothetical protein
LNSKTASGQTKFGDHRSFTDQILIISADCVARQKELVIQTQSKDLIKSNYSLLVQGIAGSSVFTAQFNLDNWSAGSKVTSWGGLCFYARCNSVDHWSFTDQMLYRQKELVIQTQSKALMVE